MNPFPPSSSRGVDAMLREYARASTTISWWFRSQEIKTTSSEAVAHQSRNNDEGYWAHNHREEKLREIWEEFRFKIGYFVILSLGEGICDKSH